MDISEEDWFEVDRWFQGGAWRTCNLTTLRSQLERISPRPSHQNPPFLAKYDLLVGALQERIGFLEKREAAKQGRGSHSHAMLLGVALLALIVGVALGVWAGPYLKKATSGAGTAVPAAGSKASVAPGPRA